ncbi:NADH dehydrogenase 1 alpha subcomplex subunit 12 ndufa12/DAP13 [Balamuthia mandrillaris]
MSLATFLGEVKRLGWKESIIRLYRFSNLKVGSTMVGVDRIGNKYYEAPTEDFIQNRWVEYADPSGYDASQVPPEWHAWLHHITDQPPTPDLDKDIIYKKPHKPNKTGTDQAYHPPGYLYHNRRVDNEETIWTPGNNKEVSRS